MSGELGTGYVTKPAANILEADLFVQEVEQGHDRFDMNAKLTDGDYESTVDGQEGNMTVKTTITDGNLLMLKLLN